MTHAVVVADGRAPSRADLDGSWPGWDADVAAVVAADGGAAACASLGLVPDLVVGDMDSLDPAVLEGLEAHGVAVRRVSRDKDETDTELALVAALESGADRITVLGAFGGVRLDHELANLALLALPALRHVDVALLDDRARVRLLDGVGRTSLALPGPIGAIVSLVPLGDGVEGVTATGFRYPLHDEALPFGPARGISNVRSAPDAAVSLRRGRMLVVETPARLRR